jgi:hypothetical protein
MTTAVLGTNSVAEPVSMLPGRQTKRTAWPKAARQNSNVTARAVFFFQEKMINHVKLRVLNGSYAVSRLSGDEPIPAWADGDGFVSISRNGDELSIVSLQERVPTGVKADLDWVCLKFLGPFAFGETGVVLSVIKPLSENGLGIFVVSTFDGDCLLLKLADYDAAVTLLIAAGHSIQ